MDITIAIGNSDNKLTQKQWSDYRHSVDVVVRHYAGEVHGAWVSPSADPFQNAAWQINIDVTKDDFLAHDNLQYDLTIVAKNFDQDSYAWLEGDTLIVNARGPMGGKRSS